MRMRRVWGYMRDVGGRARGSATTMTMMEAMTMFDIIDSVVIWSTAIIVADGHTASNAPDLFRPPKLSGAGPG